MGREMERREKLEEESMEVRKRKEWREMDKVGEETNYYFGSIPTDCL